MLACSMYTALGQRNALSMLTLSLISSGFVRIHVGTGVGYPQELISSMVRELTGSYVPLGLTNLIYCRSLDTNLRGSLAVIPCYPFASYQHDRGCVATAQACLPSAWPGERISC